MKISGKTGKCKFTVNGGRKSFVNAENIYVKKWELPVEIYLACKMNVGVLAIEIFEIELYMF